MSNLPENLMHRRDAIATFLTDVNENGLRERETAYARNLSICYQPDSYADFGLHPEFEELYGCFSKTGEIYFRLDTSRIWGALLNLKEVVESVEGSLAEVGVYRGNFSAILGWFARRHRRRLYMFDTFSGFPDADLGGEDNQNKRTAFRDTSLEIAKETVGESELFRWLVGKFPDSITQEVLSERFCFVSLDCDLYEPVRSGLKIFWERLAPGGMIFVHDYSSNHWPGVKQAVDEFLIEEGAGWVLLPDKCGTIALAKPRSGRSHADAFAKST